jgi:hypothetical protein
VAPKLARQSNLGHQTTISQCRGRSVSVWVVGFPCWDAVHIKALRCLY